MQVATAVREVTKVYPGVVAVHGVTVEFLTGEIHALIGENGAGKSTVVKMLAGMIQPDAGTIEVSGKAIRFGSPRAARTHGIGVVHQSGSLIASMTVGENLRLCRADTTKLAETGAVTAHDSFRLHVPLNRLVRDLSQRERQWLEVRRLLAEDVRLLVLDEPTSALSPQESELLFRELRGLASAGYAVVVVSHKLPELITHADRFTVMRKGQIVARLVRGEATASKLVNLLNAPAQETLHTTTDAPRATAAGSLLARIDNVSFQPANPGEAPLRGVSLTLRRGEVLGIVGQPGSGAVNILKLLYDKGQRNARSRVEWFDETGRCCSRPRAIGLVPVLRMIDGCIGAFTVAENLLLRRRHLLGRMRGSARRKQERSFVAHLIERYRVCPTDPSTRLSTLSGGNLEKVLLAREIDYARELLLVQNPTAGLDVRVSEFVRARLREKAASGACVVLHSDDLDELLAVAQRIIVIAGGRCVAELAGEQLTREIVGGALSGTTAFVPPHALAQGAAVQEATMSCAS